MQQLTNIQAIETALNQYGDIAITKNKKNIAMVMSMEEYNKKKLKKDIEEHLLKAEDDIRNGRTRDAREVFKEWKEQYGI